MTPMLVDECRVCHCTEGKRCSLRTGDECVWMTKRHDLCSNEHCIIAADRQKKEAQRARNQQKQQGPFKVIRRNQKGRATHIVRRRERKSA